MNQAIHRGNDWFFADDLDGVGCSSFPRWSHMDDADFGMRVEFVKSAAREKKVGLSELQGGRSAIGFNIYDPVDGLSQQRWIWNGIAWGPIPSCFGAGVMKCSGANWLDLGWRAMTGWREDRLAFMKVTGKFIEQHADVIDHYRPVKLEVGFSSARKVIHLTWAQEMKRTAPVLDY